MKKDVFAYRGADGGERFADPDQIDRVLHALLSDDPRTVFADLLDGEPSLKVEAGKRLQWAACEAFDLGPPFDPATGEGVRERVWLGALEAWTGWMEKNELAASVSAT